MKFHDFFQIICKGAVLGAVDQFYWKEYQARGAPHYHVLLWIRGAPIIGVNEPWEITFWIDESHLSCTRQQDLSKTACSGNQVPDTQVQ